MKFSVNWLREFVDPKISNQQLGDQLTMAGLEVESLAPACVPFSGVFTAEIIAVAQHPDADKLKVCTVKHKGEELQIVCGDPTVRAGTKVAAAIVGAKLQNGNLKIKKSKLRGVESQGMLCSKSELGLADSSQGIWVMPENTELDQDLNDYLKLNDQILELGITPNRGDCFSIRGVAREVAVINNLDYQDKVESILNIEQTQNYKSDSNLKLDINIRATEACPRYLGRVIKNIDSKATTPLWMQERLRRSGIRCLYPLVDITNYVMLELGQPMHAFDLNNLQDKIIVRYADNTEKLVLLDGKELELTAQQLVICDNNKPVALAGVMGGENSAISDNTTDVFLESAFFSPETIAPTARKYNIVTDSSQRFERGVDPNLTKAAILRATELLLAIAGTESTIVGSIVESCENAILDEKVVELRESRIARVLGIQLEKNKIETILTNLGLKLLEASIDKIHNTTVYKWQVPSHRFDIRIEEDLLEELARVYGYNNIPNNVPKRSLDFKAKQPKITLADTIRKSIIGCGYHEALNYSFIDDSLQTAFSNHGRTLKLMNPISSEMNELRLSLCPGLIKNAQHNANHQAESIKLFELGKCFYPDSNGDVTEVFKLAGVLVGKKNKDSWASKSMQVDFYDAKGNLERLFADLGLEGIKFVGQDDIEEEQVLPGLHPGRTAHISYNDKYIGWVGEVHPQLKKTLGVDNSLILFELSLEDLHVTSYTKYKEISKFPQIRRDLAFLFKNEIKVQNLYDIVAKVAKDLLKSIYVFDVYSGTGIPEGYKSVAFGMVLQHSSKTLVEDEIVAVVNKVINEVTNKLGGKLRE